MQPTAVACQENPYCAVYASNIRGLCSAELLPAVQGFFTIDVLSTVPWDIVLTNEALGLVQLFKATKVLKLVRIIRVLKLVRILRLLKVSPASSSQPPRESSS